MIPGFREPLRVLVFGSRDWTDREAVDREVTSIAERTRGQVITIVHGGARGADRMAGAAARKHRLRELVYPAQWARLGRRAGPTRNQQMIDEGRPHSAIGFVFVDDDGRPATPGSRDMYRRLRTAGIPVRLVTEEVALWTDHRLPPS